jgi:hypothetical protein
LASKCIGYRFLALLGGLLALALSASLVPSAARAADMVFWTNRDAGISFANLDGSGGGNLATGAATVVEPKGIAIDPAAGRLYWANRGNSTIAFTNLRGSGGGTLPISGTTVDAPGGLSLDPVGRRLFWIDTANDTIEFANLDGSGGGTLAVSGTAVTDPSGIAVDSVAGRVYWSNFTGVISSARLDGSDGRLVAGAQGNPFGVAVDHDRGRAYWADFTRASISFANLDGSGGGGNLATGNAPVAFPSFVALLQSPRAVLPPAIGGEPRPGSTLSCSQGTWGADLPEAQLYRAPQSFTYGWSRDGQALPGATGSSVTADREGGEYRCTVTARNHAGATAQTSAAVRVVPRRFTVATRVTLALVSRRISASGQFRVRVANRNGFPIAGALSARVGTKSKRAPKPRARKFEVAGGGSRIVKLTLPAGLRRPLAGRTKLAVALQATVADPAGTRRTIRKPVVVKLRPAQHRR